MQLLLDLVDAGQLGLPGVVEGLLGHGLKVPRVLSHAGGRGVAAGAHTAVVTQPSLVQVRVVQRFRHAHPLVRVHGQHLGHQVDGLVGGPLPHRVQHRDGRWLHALGEHVPLSGVAGVLEVGQGRCAQQVSDQLQLLDRTRRLKRKTKLVISKEKE